MTDESKIISMLLSSQQLLCEHRHEIFPNYFSETLRQPVRQLLAGYDKYGEIPPFDMLNFPRNVEINPNMTGIEMAYSNDLITDFCQTGAWSEHAYNAPELIETKQYDKLYESAENARNLGTNKDDWGSVYGSQIGKITPPIYLYKSFIIKGSVSAVYGAPGSFKSFLALHISLILATGSFGYQKTPVCYVAAEGAGGINLRAEAWTEFHNKTIGDKDFHLVTKPVNLLDNANVTAFIKYIERNQLRLGIHYGLVVIDTLAQCTPGGDENSAKDMGVATSNMIRIRRELDTTLLFVHHSGKDTSKEMRGSSSIKGNTDAMVEVIRKGMTCTAELKRQKDGPIGARIAFDMAAVAVPRLVGTELGGSLVCKITGFDKNTDPLLRAMGQVLADKTDGIMSVHKMLVALGKSDTTEPKQQIAELLPLDVEVQVDLANGSLVTLIRGTGRGYGVIRCVK